MAKAFRYHNSRSSRNDQPVADNGDKELKNPRGKARAIASHAAKEAAKKADPRVRKSAAKRAADDVRSSAAGNVYDTPEEMRHIVREARKAVKTRVVGAFPDAKPGKEF